jgi:hypothetical protein
MQDAAVQHAERHATVDPGAAAVLIVAAIARRIFGARAFLPAEACGESSDRGRPRPLWSRCGRRTVKVGEDARAPAGSSRTGMSAFQANVRNAAGGVRDPELGTAGLSGQRRVGRIGLGLAVLTSLGLGELRGADPATNAVTAVASLAMPKARVVVVEEPGAIRAFVPQLPVVRHMFDRGLTNLTGRATVVDAWRSLISTQDVVGIKVCTAPGPTSGTRPAVAEALVQSLISAGHPPGGIVIWDRQLGPLRAAGYGALPEQYGIRIAASADAGYDTNHFYDSAFIGQPVWGDHEFGQRGPEVGRRSYVSRLVTQQMTRIINLTPLLNHNIAGVSGNLVGLALGSVDNTVRFVNSPGQFAISVPEIYALPILGDRVVLNVVDALLAQYYGEERSLLHYTAVLDQLRFSTDPVALDVLSVQELARQRELADSPAAKDDSPLFSNASLVEIGIHDPKNIQVEWVR